MKKGEDNFMSKYKYLEVKVGDIPKEKDCEDILAMLNEYFGENGWTTERIDFEMYKRYADEEKKYSFVPVTVKENNLNNWNKLEMHPCISGTGGILCNDFVLIGFDVQTLNFCGLTDEQIEMLKSKVYGKENIEMLKKLSNE